MRKTAIRSLLLGQLRAPVIKQALLLCPAIAAALLVGANAPTAQAAQVHQDQTLNRMYYRYVYIPAGTTYSWETTNLTSGADTVLHLWDVPAQSEVGYDDDSGTGSGSRVSYTNTTSSTKGLMLIARAYSTGTTGSARLLQNGATLVSTIPVGGRRVAVENGTGWEHETVQAPGGARYPYMMALDSSRHMLTIDFSSGVGSQARVSHPSTYYVVMGTTSGSGDVHLYSNDPTDYDGDGLGYGLEWDLGTCDVTWWSHCTNIHNPADTDRDAIPDGAEVFGIDHSSRPQYLAAWGADPLHKDVFVELDWNDAFTAGNPFTQSDAIAAAAIFEQGLAEDLENPDGEDGVRLHLDMDRVPTDPALDTLFGDWGGSNAVPDGTDYRNAPETYRDPVRAGIFRYGLINEGSGGGQAAGAPTDRFNWGVRTSYRYVTSFAHELGHAVGLQHHGHNSWGAANGKANYLSLMNYAYPGSEFSQGDSDVVLNPAAVHEEAGIGADATHVGHSPFSRLLGSADEIDWDFDGEFSPSGWGMVRAPVTYASTSGTNAFTQNERELHNESDLPATTPALIRGPNDRMYAFYVDDDRIYYRHAPMNGLTWEGSCPRGDDIGDTCTTWSSAVQVPTSADARGLTALFADGQVLLAFRTQWDSLRTIRATGASSSGTLTGWNTETYHSATTDVEPEVELMRVNPAYFGGDNVVVALFYRNKSTGHYRWRTMSHVGSSSSTSRGNLLTDSEGTIVGAHSPTFASWPYDPNDTDEGTTCGAMTNSSSQVGIYCYDGATNRFTDLSSSALPSSTKPITSGKPGLAYHAYRSWAGIPRGGDPTRGAFWLSVVVADDRWDYADVWISDPISEQSGESLHDLVFPRSRRGKVGNVWSNLVDGSGLALYDDPELGAMKGLWLRQDNSDTSVPAGAKKIRFLPFADGGFRAALQDGNDFQVMERGICRGLADSSYCGPSSFGLD